MSVGGHRVRRKRGETSRYSERNTRKKRHYSEKLMVWALLGKDGVGKLLFLKKNETMNSSKYIKILDNNLPRELKKHKATHFIQDKASCHTSNMTVQHMKENHFSTTFLPGSSPDIIENCFGYMKLKLQYKDTRNIPNLKKAIKKLWKTISKEYIQTLYKSLKRRMKAVIDQRGAATKY